MFHDGECAGADTQPTGAQDALRAYREGKALSGERQAAFDWHVGVAMAPHHVGLQLRLAF